MWCAHPCGDWDKAVVQNAGGYIVLLLQSIRDPAL